MTLSSGAIELPLSHLSVRVPWHDTDWTGRVCNAPGANHACTVLKNVKENKDSDLEEEDAGKAWADLPRERVPPCVFERAGFMRPNAYTIEREQSYASFSKSHAHFAPTSHRMPAYCLEATPYRWVMRDETAARMKTWGIGYDEALEDEADKHIELAKKSTWVQDHRNQLALLDSFFSAIRPGKSLVFIYLKDLPLLEDRMPGTRVLVGAGTVQEVAAPVEWNYHGTGPLRSILWERAVTHSIRPSFQDGFLLPYQQLLANEALAGEDLAQFVAHAPGEHFDEFSYVSELVSHDAAIAALLELARVVDLLPGVADGPWEAVAGWLGERIADAWTFRGPCPGLGAALTAAGLERGAVVAHRVLEALPDSIVDPWPAIAAAIADAAADKGPVAGLVQRMARKAWERISSDPQRYQLLRLLSRFSLTTEQTRRLLDPELRGESGIGASDAELLENPYLLYELDRGRDDSIGFELIDRGLFPRDAAASAALAADPLPDPVQESTDDRRIRAACVELLERAAAEGHSLLDEPGLRKRLAALQLDPACDPPSDVFAIAADGFPPVLVETPLAREGRGWQVARLAQAGDLITTAIDERVGRGPIELEWQWREEIDATIEEPFKPGDNDEEQARSEKADALKILARSRIAALVGPAGTGKTTMLRALCSHADIAARGVLLLAPTGKARVQLGDKVQAQAFTLAQFLRRSDRWHHEFGYRVNPSGKKEGGFGTVVVDEASMLTEEMLAALLDALVGVERLVLCGDHRQLPPIGAGRPFADLVAHLRDLRDAEAGSARAEQRSVVESGGGLAELTIGRRQRTSSDADAATTAAGRDDLALAAWFSVDGGSPAADEVLARVLRGEGDGTLEIVSWEDEDDLHEKLVAFFADDPELLISVGDPDALKRSLGADGTYNGRASFTFGEAGSGAERWQILSPVRSRPGGVSGLNRLVRRTWRAGDATMARKSWKLPAPMGADEILFHDKVMCVTNHQHEAWQVKKGAKQKCDVANGEIGVAVHWMKTKGLKVEFSTQPGLQFTFWASDLNSEDGRFAEALELAYAVTIHKAQGSQFGITAVVVPNPCPLLSPELLYTALTRQRARTVLFIQGDPNNLRLLASPWNSETARRLTRLFRPPDPFAAPDGKILDGSHVHRTANGEMVISKSEVIVANTLRALGVEYLYEHDLHMPDGTWRRPDFTIYRDSGGTVYWEHLGMLESSGYRADWEAKKEWYAANEILSWTDGGGANGTLVWSTESKRDGIDSQEIEQLARDVLASA
jgi:hypothetical protein